MYILLSLSYIIIIPGEVFTSMLADGLSQESEWQQVSLSLQESSQYSGSSQSRTNLDGIHLSSSFQVLQFLQ